MIKLRELERKDISEINTWRNQNELIDMLGAPFRFINLEVDIKWYEDYMGNRGNTVRCAIVEENDKILGLISLTNIDFINRSAQLHIMIGLEENRNKGLGTFALSEMLAHAFYNMNLERVELTVLESNKRAQHLYEKAGFVLEGRQRNALYKNGKFVDMLMYSILRSDNKYKNKSSGGGVFAIDMVYSRQIKYCIMDECDRAFENPIFEKNEFGELFRKINVNGIFVVAYHANVLGYAVLYANNLSEYEGYLTLIAVLPEYQGKKVGQTLLLECCDIAYNRGMKRVKLEVKRDNEKAIRFYLKNGFTFDKHCSDQSDYMVKLLDQ